MTKAGELPCTLTAGKHRRYSVSDLECLTLGEPMVRIAVAVEKIEGILAAIVGDWSEDSLSGDWSKDRYEPK